MSEGHVPTPAEERAGYSDARRENALREVNRAAPRWRLLTEWAKSFIIAVGLFLVIRAFLVEAFKIPSGSMEKTLLVGDFLLVNKLIYGAQIPFTNIRLPAVRTPERGDVIVFQFPEDVTKNYVKRLVGLPGDTVAMRDGVFILNGVPQEESYVVRIHPDADASADDFRWQRKHLIQTAQASAAHPSRNNWGPLVVPDRSYFVLGDNRDNSSDSRYWGFVPDTLVRGRPFIVYYSYAPDSADDFSWLTSIRWSRLGERVR